MNARSNSFLSRSYFAAYNCGACAGGGGGPNARLFAQLANCPDVRAALARRHGIAIPPDTLFLGAEHNTTTDVVTFFPDSSGGGGGGSSSSSSSAAGSTTTQVSAAGAGARDGGAVQAQKAAVEEARRIIDTAAALNALERCRRLVLGTDDVGTPAEALAHVRFLSY
jgi:hypothetical protein